jgi:hypothetical protein
MIWSSITENAVPVLRRDAGSGELTLTQARPSTLPVSGRSVVVSPDGSFVYVGGDYLLTVFRRDPPTGALVFAEQHEHTFGIVDGLYLIGDLVGGMGSPSAPTVSTCTRRPETSK